MCLGKQLNNRNSYSAFLFFFFFFLASTRHSHIFFSTLLGTGIESRRAYWRKRRFKNGERETRRWSERKEEGRGRHGTCEYKNLGHLLQAWETAYISGRHHLFLLEMTSEKRAQKFHTDNVLLPRYGKCMLLIGWSKFVTTQKQYPYLGSNTLSVWNFCACFSDVISREN